MEVDEAPLYPTALKLEICDETTGGKCNDFQTNITGKVEGQDQTYSVEVSADKAAPIRKYDELKMFLTDGDRRMEGSSYVYPFPVYILYNPYLEDDHTYMANNSEFVLNEWGGVSTGSLHDHETMDWYYGHLNQRALDAAFYALRAMDVAKGADPANVGMWRRDVYSLNACMLGLEMGVSTDARLEKHSPCYRAFHMPGMVNQTSVGPLRVCHLNTMPANNGNLILQPHPTGYPPDHWSSTIDIIQAWNDDDKTPVKYGYASY
ncbi:hypothetical protein SARC_06873 [Sphaeroforma arctica JP610]|uniref:Uncharacterized protein n=1 Tax=Sphaeroforma arctica JP610 TaxID=667725 RepID=A0A0L0FVV5_9EUKA|nr:hypothetical protein SARC_06873 [Sphaeroforma arctica JP610]KNC80779.1 hypothetical protein SARC_06873 [Sphaeroforma arctica JP610]|eukprot:XP_014154681.1 hypothetical protein SARC_06873 [Sphaeroforma arctica JP610]